VVVGGPKWNYCTPTSSVKRTCLNFSIIFPPPSLN
jgi:hypothetical protein